MYQSEGGCNLKFGRPYRIKGERIDHAIIRAFELLELRSARRR